MAEETQAANMAAMLSAGITKVAHLQLSLRLQQPQLLALELRSVLLALPPAWRAVVSSAPAATWFQVFTGHRALGRLDDIAWLGNFAGQGAMRVAGVHIPCMGTCMVTLAILLALLRWHICVMT